VQIVTMLLYHARSGLVCNNNSDNSARLLEVNKLSPICAQLRISGAITTRFTACCRVVISMRFL
jgi:hypothetical protein